MIVARQSKPIETSSPAAVVSPLWHAMQRSDVWNEATVACGPRAGEADWPLTATEAVSASAPVPMRTQARIISTR